MPDPGRPQLALAILLAAGLSNDQAAARHQDFKFEFVAHWQAPFDVTVDPLDWSRRVKKRRRG